MSNVKWETKRCPYCGSAFEYPVTEWLKEPVTCHSKVCVTKYIHKKINKENNDVN